MHGRGINEVRSLLVVMGPVITLLIVIVWTVIAFRAMPIPTADFGMFATVADRLRAGDRLYVDVFENKDPFAHYLLAIARAPSPLGAWLLHVLYLALASAAVVRLAREAGCTRRLAVLVGLVGAPIVLTGAAFGAGTSHMIGIALCLWLVALSVNKQAFASGLLLGLIPFFKIVMVPIAFMIVAYDFVISKESRQQWRRFGWGFATALVLCGGLVAARGEFVPWMNALIWNAGYSSALGPESGVPAILFHLQSVLVPVVQVILVSAALLGVTGWILRNQSRQRGWDRETRRLQYLVVLTFLSGLVIVAASGLWPHHSLVFMVPVLICFVLFASGLASSFSFSPGAVGSAIVMAAIVLSGLPGIRAYLDPIIYTRANIGVYFAESSETALIKSTGSPTTYARVGGGDGPNHAYGLNEWELACPFFTQFVWESTEVLDATLNCLPEADVVLIEAGLKRNTGEPAWDAFVESVDALLLRDYTCKLANGAKICRKSVSESALGQAS